MNPHLAIPVALLALACTHREVSPGLELAATRAALDAALTATPAATPTARPAPVAAEAPSVRIVPISARPVVAAPPPGTEIATSIALADPVVAHVAPPPPAPRTEPTLATMLRSAPEDTASGLETAIRDLTRSMDERRWFDLLEARLADRSAGFDAAPARGGGGPASTSRLERIEALTTGLAERLAKVEAAAEGRDNALREALTLADQRQRALREESLAGDKLTLELLNQGLKRIEASVTASLAAGQDRDEAARRDAVKMRLLRAREEFFSVYERLVGDVDS